MSKDTITVNMNVYDIPIVVEQLNKLEQENKQLKDKLKGVQEERDYLFNKQSIENKYLALENKQLKEVIEEVRGYILNHELVEEKDNYVLNGKELLQILDKVKGDSNE